MSIERIIMKYSEVFSEAWRNVLDEFEDGKTCIESEGDLQCLLFSECIKILALGNSVRPIPVHADAAAKITQLGGTAHCDLALGPNDEVLVELKHNALDTHKRVKRDLAKLTDLFQLNPSTESIFLCLTRNFEDEASVSSYRKDLPSRMKRDGFEVESRLVSHQMHEQCEPYRQKNSQIHCAILIWKERSKR